MTKKLIRIIQGGMGIGVSNWKLAREVSRTGQLGVVSGTVLSEIFIRTLNDGDPGGHLIRALEYLPYPEVAEWVRTTYFKPGGRTAKGRYQATPMLTDTLTPTKEQVWVTVAAIFCEVFLAKEGHNGLVGINLLEKVQNPPHQVSLYAAMLAGVDYVLMGAGIPWQIKPILEGLAAGQITTHQVDVAKVDPMPKAAGKWNTYEITAQGPHLTVVLNGQKTADVQDSKHLGGPLALQYGSGVVKFRKVQIKPL